MAISFVGSADLGDNGGTSNNLTVSYTVGSGANRCLFVLVIGDNIGGADDITSVTYNSVNMTFVAKVVAGAGERMTYLYCLSNPNSGANNVAISCTGTHYLLAGAADYSGVGGVTTIDNSVTSTDTISEDTYTSSITTVANNCWVITGAEVQGGAGGVSGGTGATLRSSGVSFGDWGLFDSNGPKTPAGSFSATTTLATFGSGFNQIHILASFGPFIPRGFDEPASLPPKRYRIFRSVQRDDVEALKPPPAPSITPTIWGFEDEKSALPKRRRFFHQTQQDDISGLKFTLVSIKAVPWDYEDPHPPPPKRRPYFKPHPIDDTSGFIFSPFTLGTPCQQVWDPNHSNASLLIGDKGLSIADPDISPTNNYPAFALVGVFGGKRYWETIGLYTQSQNNCGTGIGGTTSINTLSTKLGNCADEIAYYPQGQVVSNSVVLATIDPCPSGTVVRHALDIVNNQYWVDPGTGRWNGSSTANPATNTGGFPLPVDLLITPVVPAVNLAGGGKFFAFFRSSSWFHQAPVGFQSFDVEWGFDEPAAPPPKRRPVRRPVVQQDDPSGFPFTAVKVATIWGQEDERATVPKWRRYSHPIQVDDTSGFPFTAVATAQTPANWGDIDPPPKRQLRKPSKQILQWDDTGGFPFTAVAALVNWGDIDPPPKRQLRKPFKQILQPDEIGGLLFTPTVLVAWGFDEPYPNPPKRRVYFHPAQPDDTSGFPFLLSPNPLKWQDIEQWVPPHRRVFFRSIQQDDISGLPFTVVAIIPWGFEEQSPFPKRMRPFRSVQQDDISGLQFTAVVTPAAWGDFDPPSKRQLRALFKQITQPDETSGFIFTAVVTPTTWGDIDPSSPPPRRFRRSAMTQQYQYAEWLPFPPNPIPPAPPSPDYITLFNDLVTQFDNGHLTQRQFFLQRYALQWAWSGMTNWDSLGLQLGMRVKPNTQPIYAPDGTVSLLPSPYNKIRNYPVVDGGTLVASAEALLSIGVSLSSFPAPPPPRWAFRYYGVR